MKKQKPVTLKKIGNLIMVDGRMYEPSRIDHKTGYEMIHFQPVPEKRYRMLLRSATRKLKSYINSDDILMSALSEMSMKQLEKINSEIKKKKPKVRQTQGCLDLMVGRTCVPIR